MEGRTEKRRPNTFDTRLRWKVCLGLLGVAVVFAATGVSLSETLKSNETTNLTFSVLKHMRDFETVWAGQASLARTLTILAGASRSDFLREIYSTQVLRSIEKEKDAFWDFDAYYERKSPSIGAYKGYKESFKYFVNDQEIILNETLEYFPAGAGPSFDQYIVQWAGLYQERVMRTSLDFRKQGSDFAERLSSVSTEASKTTLDIAISVQSFALMMFVLLVGLLAKIFRDANAKIETLETLARQQAHEMRNKYAPALSIMEQFVDTAQRDDATIEDFTVLLDDVLLALITLREVEVQHQARLDIYKILRSKYVPTHETFDVVAFMRDRVEIEKAIHRARARGTDSGLHDVEFTFVIADPQFATSSAVHIRTDLYILTHVASNLLSNARKFTHSGSVTFTLRSTSGGSLVFTVRDTGTGLPTAVVDTLFEHEVATGDVRGTGLGLPSCALFCKAGGGYIKLTGTRQQDAATEGFTEFEFAIAGIVVGFDGDVENPRAPESATTVATPDIVMLPDNVSVVVVDDSALNRKIIIRTLTRAQDDARASGWTFAQFETLESAQPFLKDHHDDHTIVTLDVRPPFSFSLVSQENMASRGGILTGLDGTRWLLEDIDFRGIIISTSGDPDVGLKHLDLGAHLNWGKPIPKLQKVIDDLIAAFQRPDRPLR